MSIGVGYDTFLLGLTPTTEYGDPSSDDLSSEWDTDDSEPAPIQNKAILP